MTLFGFLINGESALGAHLAVLVDDAMYAAFAHGLTVVYVLRREGAILAKKYFHKKKSHADSNY